jgi:hypothetical protein
VDISWRVSPPACAIHFAEGLLDGDLKGEWPPEALLAADTLIGRCRAYDVDPSEYFDHLIPAMAEPGSTRPHVLAALTRLMPRAKADEFLKAFSDPTSDLVMAWHRVFGGSQLASHVREFEQNWLLTGRLAYIRLGHWLPREVLPDTARVLVMSPARGAFGYAHLPWNLVRVEPLMGEAGPIPFMARLVWLLSLLHLDLPTYTELFPKRRWRRNVLLVNIIPALQAWYDVEDTVDEPLIRTAVTEWTRGEVEPSNEVVAALLSWWEVYRRQRPGMETSLRALDYLLEEATNKKA